MKKTYVMLLLMMLFAIVIKNEYVYAENNITILASEEYSTNYTISSTESPKLNVYGFHPANELFRLTKDSIKVVTSEVCPDDGIIFTYSFNVGADEAGYYALVANVGNISNASISPTAFAIDEGEFSEINSSNIETQTQPYTGTNSELLYQYKTKIIYELLEGEHELKVKFTGAKAKDEKVYGFFEKVEFAPISMNEFAVIEILGKSSVSQKSDNLTTQTRFDLNNYNENVLRIRSSDNEIPEEGLFIEYSFDILIEGDYSLSFSAGNYNIPHLSTYSIQVDESLITLSSSAIETEEETGMPLMKKIKLKEKFYFQKGKHTVRMVITSPKDDGSIYQYLEFFKFEFDEAVGNISFEDSDIYIECGETLQPQVKIYGAQTGREMDCSEYTLIYNGDTDVVEIDSQGVISAKNFGETKLLVSLADEPDKTAEAKVYVTVDDLYCSNPEYYFDEEVISHLNGDVTEITAKANVYNNSEQPKNVVVLLGIYENDVLIAYGIEEYKASTALQGKSANIVKATVEGIECGGNTTVQMYIWNDMDKLNPVISVNSIK